MMAKKNRAGLLLAVFILYALGSYGLRNLVILPSFSALEEKEAEQDIARVIDAINREAYRVGQQALDWSSWDDTYRFMVDRNAAYIHSNLSRASLEENVGVNLLYLCDRNGRVVWGEVFDSSRGEKITLREFPADTLGKNHVLLQHPTSTSEYVGIMLTEGGPLLISSRPVLPTSGDGPSRGTLIMGRFLNPALLQSLQQQTRIDFSLLPVDLAHGKPGLQPILSRLAPNRPVVEEAGTERLRAYGLLCDLQGKLALLVVANLPREIMARGRQAANVASLSVLATSIALVVIGSILVSLVINLLRQGRERRQTKAWSRRDLLILSMVAMAGFTLSIGAFVTVRRVEESKMLSTFKERSEERSLLIRNRINLYFAELKSLQRFFEVAGDVGRKDFKHFVQPILNEHSDIQAFEWVPRVFAEERVAHEQSARSEGVLGYQITELAGNGSRVPAGSREVYYPVAYVEPLVGNEEALGYDPGPALPSRLTALERARDTGRVIATATFPLVQGMAKEPGFLVFAPVYRQQASVQTLELRRANLVGFAMGVFRVGSVIETAIADSRAGGIDLALFDRSDPSREQLLYFHASRTRNSDVAADSVSPLSHAVDIEVGDRHWSVVCTPSPKFLAEHRPWQSSLVLVSSLLITGWLVSYLVSNRRRTARIEAVVEERTAELQTSEAKFRRVFESLQDIYAEIALPEGRIIEVSPSVKAISGFSREEMLGKLTPEFYARPEERELLIHELLSQGYVNDYEVTLVDKRGEIKVCSYMAKITRDTAGRPAGIVGTLRDISERKRAESALLRMMEDAQAAREQAERSEQSLRKNREQLIETLNELERFNRLMLAREGRVLELKAEVNELLGELGRPEAYETAGADGQ